MIGHEAGDDHQGEHRGGNLDDQAGFEAAREFGNLVSCKIEKWKLAVEERRTGDVMLFLPDIVRHFNSKTAYIPKFSCKRSDGMIAA